MTTGTVSSSNLTSLYSNTTSFTAGVVNSSVFSVNGGVGVTVNPTTGNVVVNIGQPVGTTDNVQFADVTATGDLSNNYYTLANAVGTNGQILTSNGAGATSWTTPADINTTYTINASTISGGANFNLVGSDTSIDTIKFASAGGTTITRTDANTITVSSTGTGGAISLNDLTDVILTPPLYDGQLLSYRGSDWINDQRVTTTLLNERSVFEFRPLSPTAGPNSSLFLRKNYSNSAEGTPGVGTFANGAGTGIGFQVASDTQGSPAGTAQTMGTFYGIYDTTNPYFILNTTIDNGVTLLPVATISGTAVSFDGTTLTLDANNVGAANNSSIIANRGSSGTDASLTWTESTGFWVFNEDVFGQGEIIANTTVGTNGQYVTFNNEDLLPVGDCFLLVKRGSVDPDVMIKWNETTDRWEYTFNGTNYYYLANQNLDTTSDVNFSSVTVDTISAYDTQTTTTTVISPTNISATTKQTQKVVIHIKDNVTSEIHVLEALAVAISPTVALLTTYAEMYSGSAALAIFTADVSSGTLRILATPATTNSTTFQAQRITLGN